MENRRPTVTDRNVARAGKISADGTREYRPHSAPAGPLSAEMSVAETRVYRTLRERLQSGGQTGRQEERAENRRDTLPGLAYSGEQPHPAADGSLGMSDSVVREEVRRREEFPYG